MPIQLHETDGTCAYFKPCNTKLYRDRDNELMLSVEFNLKL